MLAGFILPFTSLLRLSHNDCSYSKMSPIPIMTESPAKDNKKKVEITTESELRENTHTAQEFRELTIAHNTSILVYNKYTDSNTKDLVRKYRPEFEEIYVFNDAKSCFSFIDTHNYDMDHQKISLLLLEADAVSIKILDFLHKRITNKETSSFPLIASVVLLPVNPDPEITNNIEAAGGASAIVQLPATSAEIFTAMLNVLYRRRVVETVYTDLKVINQEQRYPFLPIFIEEKPTIDRRALAKSKDTKTGGKNNEATMLGTDQDGEDNGMNYIVSKNDDDWTECSSMLPNYVKTFRKKLKGGGDTTTEKNVDNIKLSQSELLASVSHERSKADGVILNKIKNIAATMEGTMFDGDFLDMVSGMNTPSVMAEEEDDLSTNSSDGDADDVPQGSLVQDSLTFRDDFESVLPAASKGETARQLLDPMRRPKWGYGNTIKGGSSGSTHASASTTLLELEMRPFVERPVPNLRHKHTVGGMDKDVAERCWKILHSKGVVEVDGSVTSRRGATDNVLLHPQIVRPSQEFSAGIMHALSPMTPVSGVMTPVSPRGGNNKEAGQMVRMQSIQALEDGVDESENDPPSVNMSAQGAHGHLLGEHIQSSFLSVGGISASSAASSRPTIQLPAAMARATRTLKKTVKKIAPDLFVHNLLAVDLNHRKINMGDRELFERGMRHEMNNDMDQAIACYVRARKQSKDPQLPRMFLGAASFRRGQYLTALTHFNSAMQFIANAHGASYTTQDDFICSFNRAVVHFRLGDDAAGLVDLERAVALRPNHIVARELMSLVQRRMGNFVDAIATAVETGNMREKVRENDRKKRLEDIERLEEETERESKRQSLLATRKSSMPNICILPNLGSTNNNNSSSNYNYNSNNNYSNNSSTNNRAQSSTTNQENNDNNTNDNNQVLNMFQVNTSRLHTVLDDEEALINSNGSSLLNAADALNRGVGASNNNSGGTLVAAQASQPASSSSSMAGKEAQIEGGKWKGNSPNTPGCVTPARTPRGSTILAGSIIPGGSTGGSTIGGQVGAHRKRRGYLDPPTEVVHIRGMEKYSLKELTVKALSAYVAEKGGFDALNTFKSVNGYKVNLFDSFFIKPNNLQMAFGCRPKLRSKAHLDLIITTLRLFPFLRNVSEAILSKLSTVVEYRAVSSTSQLLTQNNPAEAAVLLLKGGIQMRMEKPYNMPAMEDVVLGNVAEMGIFGHIDVLFRDHQSDFIYDLTHMIDWETYAKVPDAVGNDGGVNMDPRKSVSDSTHASKHGQIGASRPGGLGLGSVHGSVRGMGSFGNGKKTTERGMSVVINDPFSVLAQQAAADAAFATTTQANTRMDSKRDGKGFSEVEVGSVGPVVPLQAIGRRPSQLLTFGMSSLARRASIALEAAAEDDTMLDGEKSPRLRESGSIEANPGVSTGVGLGQEVVAASTSGRQGGGGSGQGTNNFDIMTAQVLEKARRRALAPEMFVTYTMTTPCEMLVIGEEQFNQFFRDLAIEEFTKVLSSINSSAVFESWSVEDRIRLARMGHVATYKSGDLILQQGEKPAHLYIIMKGMCRAYKRPQEKEIFMTKLAALKQKALQFDTKYAYHHKLRNTLRPHEPRTTVTGRDSSSSHNLARPHTAAPSLGSPSRDIRGMMGSLGGGGGRHRRASGVSTSNASLTSTDGGVETGSRSNVAGSKSWTPNQNNDNNNTNNRKENQENNDGKPRESTTVSPSVKSIRPGTSHHNRPVSMIRTSQNESSNMSRAIRTAKAKAMFSDYANMTAAEAERRQLAIEIAHYENLIEKASSAEYKELSEHENDFFSIAQSVSDNGLSAQMVNKSKNTSKIDTSKLCEIATLQWPMIFGEACLVDPEEGLSRGTIVADTTTDVFMLHKKQLQTFYIDPKIVDKVKMKSVSYPNDTELVAKNRSKEGWLKIRESLMADIPKARWPSRVDDTEPFVF